MTDRAFWLYVALIAALVFSGFVVRFCGGA
jgi:hypothetical protein